MRYIQKEKMKKIALITVICFVVLGVILAIFYNKFKKNIYVIRNNPKVEFQIKEKYENDKEIFEDLIKLSCWMYDCQEEIKIIYAEKIIESKVGHDCWMSNYEYFDTEESNISYEIKTYALNKAKELIEKSTTKNTKQILDEIDEYDLRNIATFSETFKSGQAKNFVSSLKEISGTDNSVDDFIVQLFYGLDNEKIHNGIRDCINSYYTDKNNVYERKEKVCNLISDIGQTELFAKEISDLEKYFEENNIKPKLSIYDTPFEDLTADQMLEIIHWIENQYEYYDNKEGRYCGDKYTRTIFQEAATKYNKTYGEIDAIHAQSYYLKH